MTLSTRRFVRFTAAALAASLAFAACGGDDDSDDASGDGGSSSALPTCLTFADLYAISGPESEGVDNWQDAAPLAEELGSTTEFPDLPLAITAPGEESGTFGSYVELALADIAEARLEEGKITEDQVETTRADYTASPNDNVIIDGISGDEGSFGWVGYAFADLNRGAVSLFEIDGGDGCVEPTPDTIADGSYPLARPLFIYVNTANAEENPALAAYIDFYMSDDGKASVSEADYVELDDAAWAETTAAWEDTGLSGAGGDLEGSVTVSGSSTVEPISGIVAEKFAAENPDVAISVEGPGTSDGIEKFCAGEVDVANASREIKEEEIATCEAEGIEYIGLKVAIDGLSVITQG